MGREAKLKVNQGERNRTLRGIISDANDETFTVDVEDESLVVSYRDVLTARTVFRWEKAPKPGH